jgi:hypothetical protein
VREWGDGNGLLTSGGRRSLPQQVEAGRGEFRAVGAIGFVLIGVTLALGMHPWTLRAGRLIVTSVYESELYAQLQGQTAHLRAEPEHAIQRLPPFQMNSPVIQAPNETRPRDRSWTPQ